MPSTSATKTARPVLRWFVALLTCTLAASGSVHAAAQAAPAPPGAAALATRQAPSLPDGWSIEPTAKGSVLVWSGSEVPMGGARPEFRVGADLLGFPREVGGRLHLPLTAAQVAAVRAEPARLEVWSSGRRLDLPDAPASGAGAIGEDLERAARVPTDPAARGPYGTERLDYDLAPLEIAQYAEPVEVVAEVTRPLGVPGPRPLVLILHGRHSTCFKGGPDGKSGGGWPCRAGWSPIPSHLGYRYLTKVLASQGYIAVSISANGINGQDWESVDGGAKARSVLIRHHLSLWRSWSDEGGDPWGGRFLRRVDMSNVVLVGHSRGGEGVNRAAVDSKRKAPYRIRGLVSFGPTAFGRQVRPDIPSAVVLPACDGDVSDLQGQAYVDGSRDLARSPALRSAVLALGANHNFFNTEWTPGLAQAPAFDDWGEDDPVCGTTQGRLRLTPGEQRRVGAAYTLALVRLTLRHDRAMLPLLDGTKVKPRAVGPAQVSVSPVGGQSRLLYRPEDRGSPRLARGMGGGECPGFYDPFWSSGPGPACDDRYWYEVTPHWQPMGGAERRPPPEALELSWSAKPAFARLRSEAAGSALDLSSLDSLDIRIANDPASPPSGLKVRLRDVRGRSTVLRGDLRLIRGWPGRGTLDRVQARTLRADLGTAGRIDLRRVAAIDLVATTTRGHAWVLDVRAVRNRRTSPADRGLPRVSADTVTAPEGDAGDVTTVDVKIRVSGTVRRPAKVWVQARGGDGSDIPGHEGRAIRIPAGASGVVATVPLSFRGNDVWEPFLPPFSGGMVTLSAMKRATTGRYIGGVSVVEDEEPPVLSVDAAEVTGAEGGTLRWQLRLSGPTTGAYYSFVARPTGTGLDELDTSDVDQDWLFEQLQLMWPPVDFPVEPPRRLSRVGGARRGLPIATWFDAGATEAIVEVPLRADGRAEGEEAVAFRIVDDWPDPTIPAGGLRLSGRVAAST